MNKQKRCFKLKKEFFILLAVIFLIISIIVIKSFSLPNVGKIEDGRVVYIDKISNVTKSKHNIVIEFENNHNYIDNCIMTKNLYNEFRNGNSKYELDISEYSKLKDLTTKEIYNIDKSLELGLIKEDTMYADYFAITCGFKNKKELMKYTKAVMKLANKGM